MTRTKSANPFALEVDVSIYFSCANEFFTSQFLTEDKSNHKNHLFLICFTTFDVDINKKKFDEILT